MAGLQPASVESDIYEQFDIRQRGGARRYYCLLPPCFEKKNSYPSCCLWKRHRNEVHKIPVEENHKIPSGWEMLRWVANGKPRNSGVPVQPTSVKLAGNATAPTGSAVDPKIFNQMDIRVIDGKERFFCLLDPCREQNLCFADHTGWKAHRQLNHDLQHDLQHASTIPSGRMVQQRVRKEKSIPFQIAPTNPTIDLGSPIAGLQPASVQSDIYLQFDFRSGIYYCLLPPCSEKEISFSAHRKWKSHRNKFHQIPEEENDKIPSGWEIRRWIADGKPRTYGIESVKPKTEKKSDEAAGSSLAGLQLASMESDKYEQFEIIQNLDGRHVYLCLLPPCFANKTMFETIQEWQDHRNHFHKIPDLESNSEKLREIRSLQVAANGKRRPSDVPVEPARTEKVPGQTAVTAPTVDWEIFNQFDVGEVDGQKRYFCLLEPCRQENVFSPDHRGWKVHRMFRHNLPDTSATPSKGIVEDWIARGKPIPYQGAVQDPPIDSKLVVDPASNIFCQFDVRVVPGKRHPQYYCLFGGCKGKGKYLSKRHNLQSHRRRVHKRFNLEDLPSARVILHWLSLGRPRPFTPTLEVVQINNPALLQTPHTSTPANIPRTIPAGDVEASSREALPLVLHAQKKFDVGAPSEPGPSVVPAQKKLRPSTIVGHTALRATASSGAPTDSESLGHDSRPGFQSMSDNDNTIGGYHNPPQDSDDSSRMPPEDSIHSYGDYVRRAISGLPSQHSSTASTQSEEPEVTSAPPSRESEIQDAHCPVSRQLGVRCGWCTGRSES